MSYVLPVRWVRAHAARRRVRASVDNRSIAGHNPRPMHRRSFFALLSLAATLGATAACRCSQDKSGSTDEVGASRGAGVEPRREILKEQSFQLDNGLRVDLVEGPCGDSATLAVLLNVGIDHDPAGRSGLVHLARRLSSSSPLSSSPFSSSGGGGAPGRVIETGDDYTLYSVTAASDKLLDEIDALGTWMSGFAPTEEDLVRERGAMLQELAKLRGEDAAATAKSFAEESVRPTRGDGKRNGVAPEVETTALAELQAFWTAHITPGNARIAVLGRFDDEQVRARIHSALGSLPKGTAPVAREPAGASARGTLVMGDAPSAVAVAVPAPEPASLEYPAFLLLAARLMADQPADGWKVEYDAIKRPGLLFITGPVGPTERPEPAAQRIRTEVGELLAQPVVPEAVAGAQARYRLLLEPKLTDPSLCAKEPRSFALARLRRAQMEGTPTAQALVDIDDEQLQAARELFGPKRSAAVIAGGVIR